MHNLRHNDYASLMHIMLNYKYALIIHIFLTVDYSLQTKIQNLAIRYQCINKHAIRYQCIKTTIYLEATQIKHKRTVFIYKRCILIVSNHQ